MFNTKKQHPYNPQTRQNRGRPNRWQKQPVHQPRQEGNWPRQEGNKQLEKIRNRHPERFITVYTVGHGEQLQSTWDEENETCYYFRKGMMTLIQTHQECSCAMCFRTIQELFKKHEQKHQPQPKRCDQDLYWQS